MERGGRHSVMEPGVDLSARGRSPMERGRCGPLVEARNAPWHFT